MLKNLCLSIAATLALSSCASLESLSLTPIPADRSNKISTEASRWIIFGFNFDNDYVDQMTKDLSAKCPAGKVTGILTKDESIQYFSVFVMKRQVTATGYCLPASKVAAR